MGSSATGRRRRNYLAGRGSEGLGGEDDLLIGYGCVVIRLVAFHLVRNIGPRWNVPDGMGGLLRGDDGTSRPNWETTSGKEESMEVLAEGQLVECITIPQEEYKQLTAERDRYKEDAERLANMLDTETREHLAFSVQVGERIADLTRQNEALSQEAK